MNPDHPTAPAGHKTARRRGWRITLLRRLAKSQDSFTARDLMKLVAHDDGDDGLMSLNQARALCQRCLRNGELQRIRKGIGGRNDSVEAVYTKAYGQETVR